MIRNRNQSFLPKMSGCRVQEELFKAAIQGLRGFFSEIRSQDLAGNGLYGRQVNTVFWNWKGSFEGRIAGTMDTNMDTNEKEATASVP
jgi:hypothetical protein